MVRYVTLKDPSSHERMLWIVIDPFFRTFQRTPGLEAALDLQGLPVCTPMLISRAPIALNELETILENQVLKVQPFNNP
ncbi:hypothetical protein NWFMUON74_56710 [Nocardia wallacei]|uniref:Uncharacterized protein n=1 Tax=Nocardia wallacei TaxID=480035 RepID=A0A7G1KVA2_9NOCA|nr:hypothetical protein NWFMUON74_56710 [Nocardia wallacei]